MRTTVTLDPDVEKLLRQAIRETGRSFKDVLNEAVREGLTSTAAKKARPFRMKTFRMGRPVTPGIDLTKALALSAEIEDQEIIRKLDLDK